jgi:hypothetical protein
MEFSTSWLSLDCHFLHSLMGYHFMQNLWWLFAYAAESDVESAESEEESMKCDVCNLEDVSIHSLYS